MEAPEAFPHRAMMSLRVAVVAYTEYQSDPRVRREAEALASAGGDVHVISLRTRLGPSPSRIGGVRLHELPLTAKRGGRARYAYQYGIFLLMSTALLVALGFRRRFDLLHVHSLPDFQVLCTLPLRVLKVPVVLDLHEAMPEIVAARFHLTMDAPLVRAAIAMEQMSCRVATHIVVANDAIRLRLVSRGANPNRISVIYNSASPATPIADELDLRKAFGLRGTRLVVHAGGINPERDLVTVLEAMARLGGQNDVCLVMAGDGDPGYVATLLERARQLALSGRVKYLGKLSLSESRQLLSLSEVGLVTLEDNPLTRIALPTRVLEMIALSKPLILPRLPHLQEVIGEGATYYEPGDPASLARAMEDVLTHEDQATSRTELARRASQRYDWERNRSLFLDICRNLGGVNVS